MTSSPARVLLLIKGLGRGGAEELIVSSARYFDTYSFTYEVAYLLERKSALVPELRARDLPVTCLGARPGSSWVRRLRRLVEQREIDLVHAHSPHPAIWARCVLAGRRRAKLVYTEHGVWSYYRRPTYWGNLLTFHRNDHVFAVSPFVRSEIRYPAWLRWLRMPPVEVLYHGIDTARLDETSVPSDEVRAEMGIPPDAAVVGMVGNFRPQKRYDWLVSAAPIVKARVPSVRFVFVGTGALEDPIRASVSRLQLDDAVIFAGQANAARLMAAFDVFVLASAYEGLSIALLEALALARPTVVTDVGGIAEMVKHGEDAWVVPPDDPPALAEGIIHLLVDEEARTKLVEGAKRRAASFDLTATVRRQEEVYRSLLGL